MVIHSIEGGCPAKAEGNLEGGPTATDAAGTFQYKIPEGISPGEYTLAWTWFNRLGNREMYMNCAPISVTGGNKRRDLHKPGQNATATFNATETYASDDIFKRDTAFPEMFKANIPTSDCSTDPSKDVVFPNPGSSVERAGDAVNLAQPTGPKCGGGSPGGISNAAPAAGSGSASDSSPSPSSGSGSGSGSGAGSSSGSGSPSGSAPAPAMTSLTPSIVAIPPAGTSEPATASVASAAQSVVQPAASVVSDASPTPAATGSLSSGAANTSSSSCSPGQMVCSPDGTKFGVCDQGSVVFQPVAAGTACKNGLIGFSGAKRSAKYARSFKA
ncbi:MAG: hypothetical protein Q9211_007134 [Gyalolechia sp. 1 TL-2023]